MRFDKSQQFVAQSAHRDFPVRPWTGSQLVRALGNGHVCETIPADARVNDTRRVTSDQWPDDAWWSWFELYGGRFTCSDQGIRKDGDCLFTSRDKSHAVCFLDFSRIRMRYSLRVAVRNPKRGDEPLALIEAGNVTASAKSAEARLQVEKHSDFTTRTMRTTLWILITMLAIEPQLERSVEKESPTDKYKEDDYFGMWTIKTCPIKVMVVAFDYFAIN
ncbi:hypothetical protein HPB52_016182 [Rhipicephalus sanguineus]|uniref:Uncharacterized protein n=1 Tax=Rhipicephalus sanguineus TaxID=34632 RepID=A0A9D4Q1W4_RHISA|nr:hypothetical protein HPB52_016182 [Rhipicephalus sanguineus]